MSSNLESTLHRDVYAVIDADLPLEETRAAFWALIPQEFRVTHHE